jgi:hypothetical protein
LDGHDEALLYQACRLIRELRTTVAADFIPLPRPTARPASRAIDSMSNGCEMVALKTIAFKRACIRPVEITTITLVLKLERLSLWREIDIVPASSYRHPQLVMVVHYIRTRLRVLSMANDNVVAWIFLAGLLNELLSPILTGGVVVALSVLYLGGYKTRHADDQ